MRVFYVCGRHDSDGKQIGAIFSRLQKAETKLVDMMGKVQHIHCSFADGVGTGTRVQSNVCSKAFLEDEDAEQEAPDDDDNGLYTASEGEE